MYIIWGASLVGFIGFLMSAMRALFLSIFCDGLGPGYIYYVPPHPLYKVSCGLRCGQKRDPSVFERGDAAPESEV